MLERRGARKTGEYCGWSGQWSRAHGSRWSHTCSTGPPFQRRIFETTSGSDSGCCHYTCSKPALTPLGVAHKPLIKYGGRRTVKGRSTAEAENEELDRQYDTDIEERQGYDKDLTADKKEGKDEKGFHNFLRRGTTCILDVLVPELDTVRHRGPPTAKILERGERKEKSIRRSAGT